MFSQRSGLLLLSIASLVSVKAIPVNNIRSLESNEIYSSKSVKQVQPNSRIIFGQPQFVSTHRLTQPSQLQSRIQFPESEPEFEGDISDRTTRDQQGTSFREATWKYDKSTSFGIDVSAAATSTPILKSPTIKFEHNEVKPYQYYWLRQYLTNNIEIIDDEAVRAKLNQIEKIIEQEVFRSTYLSLFQTPNLKKTWLCPTGKRRDHAGNCTVPLSFTIRNRPS